MITSFALFLLGCVEPSGPRITAGDLATTVPAFSALPATTVIGYAPQPGVTRTLTVPELVRYLPAAAVVSEGVCVQWRTAPPDPDSFRAVMMQELPPDAQLAVLDISRYPVPHGTVHFPLSGLRPPSTGQGATWRGFVEYAPGLRFEIWARVDIQVPATRIVAAQSISAGTSIEPDMVRAESVSAFPGSAAFAIRLEDVIGRTVRRQLPAGAPVPTAALDRRTDVRKGDTLRVKVSAGAATIALEGTALAAAVAGDTIPVRVSETGRTVRARVAAPREALVQVSGAN